MKKNLLVVALLVRVAHAAPFEDLGNCREQSFKASDKQPARTVTYERDAKHRVTRATSKLASGAATTETRTYDDQGRIATVTIDTARVVNQYDAKTGRLAHTIEYQGAAKTPSRTWSYEYDAAGHLVRESAAEGDKTTIDKRYTYDKAGRVEKMAMDGGATTETRTYDEHGLLVKNVVVVSGNTIVFTYRYDDKGRRLEQANPNGRIEYSYDCH